MQKINLNEKEIYDIVKSNNFNYEYGSFGSVFKYKDGLGLKFSAGLVGSNGFDKEYFESHKDRLYVNEKQIELLASKQDKVRFSSLPKGVAYYNGVPIGVILKYFDNHKGLYNIKDENPKDIISVFFNVIDIIDELIYNNIYQLDIKESNFLYSLDNRSTQAIDLDGEYIKFSSSNDYYECSIYSCLFKMFSFLVKTRLLDDVEKKLIDLEDAKERIEFLKKHDRGVYYFGILESFIYSIDKSNILDYDKKIR